MWDGNHAYVDDDEDEDWGEIEIPLSEEELRRIEEAAARAGKTPDQWMQDALARQLAIDKRAHLMRRTPLTSLLHWRRYRSR